MAALTGQNASVTIGGEWAAQIGSWQLSATDRQKRLQEKYAKALADSIDKMMLDGGDDEMADVSDYSNADNFAQLIRVGSGGTMEVCSLAGCQIDGEATNSAWGDANGPLTVPKLSYSAHCRIEPDSEGLVPDLSPGDIVTVKLMTNDGFGTITMPGIIDQMSFSEPVNGKEAIEFHVVSNGEVTHGPGSDWEGKEQVSAAIKAPHTKGEYQEALNSLQVAAKLGTVTTAEAYAALKSVASTYGSSTADADSGLAVLKNLKNREGYLINLSDNNKGYLVSSFTHKGQKEGKQNVLRLHMKMAINMESAYPHLEHMFSKSVAFVGIDNNGEPYKVSGVLEGVQTDHKGFAGSGNPSCTLVRRKAAAMPTYKPDGEVNDGIMPSAIVGGKSVPSLILSQDEHQQVINWWDTASAGMPEAVAVTGGKAQTADSLKKQLEDLKKQLAGQGTPVILPEGVGARIMPASMLPGAPAPEPEPRSYDRPKRRVRIPKTPKE